jgi:hypothetical protein
MKKLRFGNNLVKQNARADFLDRLPKSCHGDHFGNSTKEFTVA